jgi:uncharacterized protein (DUF885 family)
MFEQDLKRSTQMQSYLGYKWDYGKWNDISEVTQDATRVIAEERLVDLEKFDLGQLSVQEKLSVQVAIQRRLTNDEFRHHSYIMYQFRAFHTMVPSFLINIHGVKSVDDAKAYIAGLNGVKPMFTQVIEQIKKRETLGFFPPKWAYDQMIQASHNVIAGNPFEASLNDLTIWADFTGKLENLN